MERQQKSKRAINNYYLPVDFNLVLEGMQIWGSSDDPNMFLICKQI